MTKILKRLFIGALFVSLIAAQSSQVLAATDQEVLSAANSGVDYLANNQNNDGSIAGYGGETEWSVVAIKADGEDPKTFDNGSGTSIVDSLANNPPSPTASATDVERKVIAISAAGEDSKNFGGVDYSSKLESYHNNAQIGETNLLNDDIFGVIAIGASKDQDLYATAQDGLNYFLAHQNTDGGFSYTTDSCAWCGSDSNDTSAAIIAISASEKMQLTNAGLADSKNKAIVYLLSTQKDDGGFGYDAFSPSDGSSTAWALMALNTVGKSVYSQALAARDWLLANQNPDGGFSFGAYGINSSDTYTTAHAIIALLGSNWLLNPAPISGSTDNSPQQTVSSTSKVKLASATSSPESSFATNNGVVNQSASQEQTTKPNSQETLASNTSNSSQNKESKPSTNYSLYTLLILSFIALGWYVLQSLRKQGVKNV